MATSPFLFLYTLRSAFLSFASQSKAQSGEQLQYSLSIYESDLGCVLKSTGTH